MASTAGTFWKDDEIVVDRDGISHFTGVKPELMREYRKRVLFAYSSLEGDGDNEEKEARDLAKKQKGFAKKLLNGLHGEAWRCCQDLLTQMDRLTETQGYKHVFAALQAIKKVSVVKKTEQFDRSFERGFRKRGQPLDVYIRSRRQEWADLQDLDDGTKMSDDLLAYFFLKHSGLSKEDRRQILLNSGSSYDLDSIEKAMRVSFHDVHEREKQARPDERRFKGGGKGRRNYAHMAEDDEASENADQLDDAADSAYDRASEAYAAHEYDEVSEHYPDLEYGYDAEADNAEVASDAGASNDEDIFQAFSAMDKQRKTYKEARKKLREVQKQRGFFRGELPLEQRKTAIAKEKERSRCSTCNRIGHWSGDPECPKAGKSGPKGSKGRGKSPGFKKKAPGKAYFAAATPLFFTLDDDAEGEASNAAYMNYVTKDPDSQSQMEQDEGYTELDDRRKVRSSVASEDGRYLYDGYSETPWSVVKADDMPETAQESKDRDHEVCQQLQMPVRVEKLEVKVIPVKSLKDLRPELLVSHDGSQVTE